MGAGVSLDVRAGVVVLAGEGAVLALCKALPVKFGTMKVGFDVTLVATACIVSFADWGTWKACAREPWQQRYWSAR